MNENSSYHKTINLMHSAQSYRMIGVHFLSEKHPFRDDWADFHHLIVEIATSTLVHYIFMLDKNGGDSLYHIDVEHIPFESALFNFTQRICTDGQATLHVFPM